MPSVGLALLASAALTSAVPETAPPPRPARLRQHLEAWDAAMRQVESFSCAKVRFVRTDVAPIRRVKEYDGSVVARKPNLLRVRADATYLCDGQSAFEYDAANRMVTEWSPGFILGTYGSLWDVMTGAGRAEHSVEYPSVWNIVLGNLTPRQLAVRFDAILLKEDENYVYLRLTPRESRDRAKIESFTVALFQPAHSEVAYLPAQVQIVDVGGRGHTDWQFVEPAVNSSEVKATDFRYVPPPDDWKVVRRRSIAEPR